MHTNRRFLVGLFVFAGVLLGANQAQASVDAEPIAYIGHGAMFDGNGKEIQLTPTFVANAQKFYLNALLKRIGKKQSVLYKQKHFNLFNGKTWDTRSQLYINFALIEWLIKEAKLKNAGRLSGKINLLKQKIISPSYHADPTIKALNAKPYALPDKLKSLLTQEGLAKNDGGFTALSTTSGGAAYIAECSAAGVPTPPDWGNNQWVSQGILTNEFISGAQDTEVFTYNSPSNPEGMCIALPRSTGITIDLLGIICLGKVSSAACFWDNQVNKVNTPIPKVLSPLGTTIPISDSSYFAGGADLNDGTGGTCTGCHAGENPYLIHPGTNLGNPKLNGLPLRADNWYHPIVHSAWPQNPGPTNILDNVGGGQCTGCHTQTGGGGRFPILSKEFSELDGVLDSGYCNVVLKTAFNKTAGIPGTMPPGNAGSSTYNPQYNALIAACSNLNLPVKQPLAAYSFDNTSTLADTALDDTKHGHNGVLPPTGATRTPGKIGSALNFLPDNNIQEFSVQSGNSLIALNVLEEMTGIAWVKPKGPQSTDNNPGCTEGTIFSKGGSYWFQLSQNNKQIHFQNEGSGTELAIANYPAANGGVFPLDQWTQIAFVRGPWNSTAQSQSIQLYVNGTPVTTQTGGLFGTVDGYPSNNSMPGPNSLRTRAASNNSPLMVGNYGFLNDPGACEFNGDIDEIKIHDVALSAAEIMSQYQSYPAMIITISPATPVAGQLVTLKAEVTGYSPTGTVQFKVNNVNVGSPVTLTNGLATLTTSLNSGANAITATYSGDANNVASTTVAPSTVTVPGTQTNSTEIPTLPEWATIILASLLLGTGVWKQRMSRRVY